MLFNMVLYCYCWKKYFIVVHVMLLLNMLMLNMLCYCWTCYHVNVEHVMLLWTYYNVINMLCWCYCWRYLVNDEQVMLLWPWYYANVEHVMLLWPGYDVNVEYVRRLLLNTLFQCDRWTYYYKVMVEHIFVMLLMFRLSVSITK